MAVSKAKKIEQLTQLESLLKSAKSVGFTSNKGISVLEVTQIKRELRAQNAVLLVIKKTLMRRAFQSVYNIDLDISTLPGQVSLIITQEDPIAPLGIVGKYANEWKKEEKITFVAGYFEEKLLDGAAIRKIAFLPSREVLLSKMLGSLLSPLSSLARFFDASKKDLETKALTKVADLIVSEAPKAEAEAPKAEAEAPKAEAEAPKAEADAPKTEAEAPKAEADAPKTEAEAPKTEAEAPKTEAEVK